MMESSNTKANTLFLLGKEMDQGKLRGMQMNKATMQIITRKLTGYLVMKVELRMIFLKLLADYVLTRSVPLF